MERRSSVGLENVASSKEISPVSLPSANVGPESSTAETQPHGTPDNQIAAVSSSSPAGSAIIVVGTSPTDSGYVEANSSTISADSTHVQGVGGSLESSPVSGDAVEIKESQPGMMDSPSCEPSDQSETPSTAGATPEFIQISKLQTSSPISNLLERTGYPLVQQNGQRRYGPPPSWDGTPPPRGSEVFVGKIPRDCFEDELVPVFEQVGMIYEIRLMMDHFSDLNRGYAFVVFSTAGEAKECVKQLNNYEIRQGRTLGICMSVDNCRLFIGGIPKKVTKDDIIQEMTKVTEGVVDVIVYPSASDKSKNRGFAFVEYDSHRSAAMARRKLMNNRIQLWGHNIAVDWAEPELEVDEEIMSQVKVLYVRNLMLATTEAQIEEAFSVHAPVERVKKIKDYAFVHFGTKQNAHMAMQAMNGTVLDGAQIEVTLAKPVDKDSYMRSPKYNRQMSVPAFYVPVDQFGSIVPFYPSYYSPPKYMLRNSMGACAMVRMGRGARGGRIARGVGGGVGGAIAGTGGGAAGYYPAVGATATPPAAAMSFTSPPQPRFIYQANPTLAAASPVAAAATASPQFYPATPTAAYFDAAPPKRPGEEQQLNMPPGAATATAALVEVPTAHPGASMAAVKATKNSVQILEDICQKSNWGQPIFTLHSTTANTTDEEALYLYKVMVPGLSMTYIPAKLTRNIEEAKVIAADYSLVQLGYPMEAAATGYSPAARPLHFPPEIPMCAANFVAVQSSPKPAPWATLGTVDPATAAAAATAAAIYPGAQAYTPENPFPAPQGYVPHPQEYYQQGY